MKEYKTITLKQEKELYAFPSNGGFHYKYIFNYKNNTWLELTKKETKERIDGKMKFVKDER